MIVIKNAECKDLRHDRTPLSILELQSKAGINYKYNDERISIITTPNPDMLINDKAKVNIIKIFKRIFETVKNFYW